MSLLILVGLFGLVYVFFLRPRAQAARRQRDTIMELNAGDEVLTAAGIFGTVLDVEADRVTIETAPGTRITVVRSTIARRITQPDVTDPTWDEHDDEDVHDAYHDYKTGHDEDEDEDGVTDEADHDEDEVDQDDDEVDEPEEVDEDEDGVTDEDVHDDDEDEDEVTDEHDEDPETDGPDVAGSVPGDGAAPDDQDAAAGGRRARRKRRPA